MEKLDQLMTEARNPATANLDQLSTLELIRTINAADREVYARTKLALARQEWEDVQAYADAKTEVVAAILARAAADNLPLRPEPLPEPSAVRAVLMLSSWRERTLRSRSSWLSRSWMAGSQLTGASRSSDTISRSSGGTATVC